MPGPLNAEPRPLGLVPLVATLAVALFMSVAWRPDPPPALRNAGGAWPAITPKAARATSGLELRITAEQGGQLLVSDGPEGPMRTAATSTWTVRAAPDTRRAARMLAHPTAVQWLHPLPGLPAAQVLRTAELDDRGRQGPLRMHTLLFADHGTLPVVSLALPEGALFDPDTGIYTVGNAMLHPPGPALAIYREDGRWWKYPGNYHMRGKAWQRAAHVQVLEADGAEAFQGPVGLRIHGNMTRGFPLKALRLVFKDPPSAPLLPGGEGAGARALLLRPGGNDGNKALMRDAVANELCAGLAFEGVRARPAVVYLNGAYWGIHHLQQRLDEKELARRHGLRPRDVATIEVVLRNIEGDAEEAASFRELVRLAGAGDAEGTGFLQAIEARLDLDGFLTYMAACMVLGQQDWPLRNVRPWRHAGTPGAGRADGRWRFLLNDLDLAMGANTGPEGDLFHQLDRRGYALPDLWRGLMRNAALRDRFAEQVEFLLAGPLSTERQLAVIDRFAAAMAPEMQRHVDRWRKPVSVLAWEREVELLRTFARERPAAVRRQLAAWRVAHR